MEYHAWPEHSPYLGLHLSRSGLDEDPRSRSLKRVLVEDQGRRVQGLGVQWARTMSGSSSNYTG